MELNKRTKIAGGVLAVALAALGFDHFSAGPQGAEAAEPLAPILAPAAAKPLASESPDTKGRLARRLSELAAEVTVGAEPPRDAFMAPNTWFAKEEPVVVEQPRVEAKAIKHRLTAVMGGDFAKVDDHLLHLGKAASYDGEDKKSHEYELVAIRRDDSGAPVATVRIDGVEFNLGISAGERPPRPDEGKVQGR